MGLLWKHDNPKISYNRALAKAKLQHLSWRWNTGLWLRTVVKGYNRRLSKEEVGTISIITEYIPHCGVKTLTSQGRWGWCLMWLQNTMAYPWTISHCQDLPSCLFCRHWGYVLPHQCNTDALKFLWWPDNIEDQPEHFKILVHIFGPKSSPCCANKALNNTAQDNKDNSLQEVVETVHRNFCVTRLSSLEPHQPCNCTTLLIHPYAAMLQYHTFLWWDRSDSLFLCDGKSS